MDDDDDDDVVDDILPVVIGELCFEAFLLLLLLPLLLFFSWLRCLESSLPSVCALLVVVDLGLRSLALTAGDAGMCR